MALNTHRFSRLFWWAVLIVAVCATASLLPDLWGFTPYFIRSRPVESGFALVFLALAIARFIAGSRLPPTRFANLQALLKATEQCCEECVKRRATQLLCVACIAFLVMWVPAYLVRPWFRDVDAYASLAHGWSIGVRPYRDVAAYTFPGQIYVCYAIGAVLGWGRTAPFYLFDVALLCLLFAATVFWSRRCFQASLPGWVTIFAILGFYANLDYMHIAQRDWQAALLVTLGLLALDGWPGWSPIVLAAFSTALATTLRPHVTLLFPALALAIWSSDRRRKLKGSTQSCALAIWIASYAGFTIIAFAPLWTQGLLGPWFESLKTTAYGGPYAQTNPQRMLEVLREELTSEWTPLLLVLIGIAGWCAPASIRRSARWIGVAIVGSVCWRALHPVPHAYLSLPRHLFLFLAIAPCVAWLCHARRIGGTEQLLVVALILYEAVPQMPHTFRPRESLQALKPLWRGELPVYVPTGCESGFGQGDARAYRWDDYRATVDYLRRNTSPQTYVANMLRQFPFPALNGPAGRLDPFPYESGIGWIWMVRQDLDSHFANALARISDVVVVWVPDERVDKRMRLTDLTALVRCKFALSARFGRIEVWRRK